MAGNANYNTDLLATTFELFLSKQPKDAIFNDLVLFDVLEKRAKIKRKGGIKLLEPLMYAKSTSGGSYSGYDTFDVSPQEGFTNAEYSWKFYEWSISISGPEELQNAGESQMIDLLEGKWEQTRMSMQDKLDQDSFLDGTGNNSKELTGLALMVDNAGTYGNIVRSTNTWWKAVETAAGGVLAVSGSAGMRRIFNDASLGKAKRTPNLIIGTQIEFEAYEALMDANMRFTNTGEQNVGFSNPNLMFRSAPLFWDEYCQSGVMYFLNTEFMKLVVHEERDFKTSEWKKPVNQDAKVAQIFFAGEMVSSNCRHLAKLTGITNT